MTPGLFWLGSKLYQQACPWSLASGKHLASAVLIASHSTNPMVTIQVSCYSPLGVSFSPCECNKHQLLIITQIRNGQNTELQGRTLSLFHTSNICLLPYQVFGTTITPTLPVLTYVDLSTFSASMLHQTISSWIFPSFRGKQKENKNQDPWEIPKLSQ